MTMPEQLGRRQRTILIVAVCFFVAMAVASTGTFVLLATRMHDLSDELSAAIQTTRVATKLEDGLLRHDGARSEASRQEAAAWLRRTVAVARQPEHRDVDFGTAAVTAYLDAFDATGPLPDELVRRQRLSGALAAVSNASTSSTALARQARARTERWLLSARVLGVSLAVLLSVGTVLWLCWLSGVSRALARERAERMTFLAGVAHDLRNPLTAIQLSLERIGSAEGPVSQQRLLKALPMLRRQVSRLDRMVGDFLDSVRIETGHLELELEACDLRDTIWSVRDLFQGASPDHEIVTVTPDTPLRMVCDATRIEQVLTNLVSNAIKYSPLGGKISVVLEQTRDTAVLSVSDPGLGIADADQQLIFEPFRRVKRAGTARGAGIGLFVARRLVEAHGGRISVESHADEGSTFRVHLPFDSPAGQGRSAV